jgi:hypothetical protein
LKTDASFVNEKLYIISCNIKHYKCKRQIEAQKLYEEERMGGKDLALPSSQIHGGGDSLLFDDHTSTTHKNLVIPSRFVTLFLFCRS